MQNLLPTVVSRAEVISFTPVSSEKIREYIKSQYPHETDRLDFLVRNSGGIPGEADKMIADKDFENIRTQALEYLPKLISGKSSCAFEVSDLAVKNAERINAVSYTHLICLARSGRKFIIITLSPSPIMPFLSITVGMINSSVTPFSYE